ncbi:alpha-N-acetylneuraminide alpha-2,8-sialyltransferase-like [Asterias rubens]|uniref:alpha-N-acetylneuraminide alpha-2,8-sialyltransferase-like n=1 Tax=Asterias rubens TaxID=7604 RepID=UPI0014553D6A|nr:alpha-N-acetylneuraminide alpha-2,8-sialyltransferase-like [Asterias rubens]
MELPNLRTLFVLVIVTGACIFGLLTVLHSTWTSDGYILPLENGQLTRGKLRFPVTQKKGLPKLENARPGDETSAVLALHASASPTDNHTSPPSYNIDMIKKGVSRVWVSNETRKSGVRRKLNSIMDAKELAVMTKRLSKIGQTIRFAITNKSRAMTEDIYTSLPEQSPFANETLQRCIVVGNGGILTNSRCGTNIDRADFVFRCNTPPLRGYAEDVGTKTNIASINPSIIASKYKRLLDKGHKSTFLNDVKRFGRLLVPLYGVPSGYAYIVPALKLLQTSNNSTPKKMVIINPNHFRAVAGIWAEMGLKDRMTTGFYLTSLALSVCGSVELFGFWPFPLDTIGNPVPYHYYGKDKITKGVHDFNLEFALLYQLHTDGVLRMHVGSCVSNT